MTGRASSESRLPALAAGTRGAAADVARAELIYAAVTPAKRARSRGARRGQRAAGRRASSGSDGG